jgi:hypothetical protein
MDEKGRINDIDFNVKLLEMYFEQGSVIDPYINTEYMRLLADHPEAVINPRAAASGIPVIDVNNIFRQVIFAVCGPGRHNRAINLAGLSHSHPDCKNGSLILLETMRFIISSPSTPVSSNYKAIVPKCAELIDATEDFVRFMRCFEEPYYRSCNNIYDYISALIFIHDTEMLRSYEECNAREHYSEFPLIEMLIGATYGIDHVVNRDHTYAAKMVKLIERLA